MPALGLSMVLLLAACGEELKDSSYTNPQWRTSLKTSVSFPLAQELTITVGLSSRMSPPEAGNLSLLWLEKRTNVRLQFVTIPDSPGDVEFGQILRAGKLPDILPEERIDLAEESVRRLFVNVAEFPGLTPHFLARLRADPELMSGIVARTTEKGELASVGSYRRDSLPYAGVLAYRRDLFEQRRLGSSSWEEIAVSLESLKRALPGSVPFGGFFDNILTLMPSWFGSGYDPANVVYYDLERKEWVFGPDEDGFRELVTFLADLYRRGLLNPDLFVGQEDMTGQSFSNGSSFMAPWKGATGPFFPYAGEGYGKLTDEGEWDGNGVWVESLPLPARAGRRVRATAALASRVGAGWLVYDQSPRVAEALALLDLMDDADVSLAMALGPEGTAWERSGGKVRLTGTLPETFRTGSISGVQKALAERGTKVGLDLGGVAWSFFDALGFPASAPYTYYLRHDLASNRPGVDIPLQPGLRVPQDSSFREARSNAVVSLKTAVESGVATFIVGRRPIAQYDAFRSELQKMGAAKLLELYRARATLVDPKILSGAN